MSERQERQKFDKRHAPETVEITVLTGTSAGGAGRAGGDALWTASANVLAYVDEHGDVVVAEGRLEWLATEEQTGTWIHDLQPLTQYVMRARRASPDPAEYAKHGMAVSDLAHHFALDEVLAHDVHVAALDERKARWLEPVTLATDVGEFTLERGYGQFVATVDWRGHPMSVMLELDDDAEEGAETCTAALTRFRQCVADSANVDARWRAYAAATLTELANDWAQDEDGAEGQPAPERITEEVFAERIRLDELSVTPEGSMTPFFADGDLFWGHVILLDVESDGTVTDAYIAG